MKRFKLLKLYKPKLTPIILLAFVLVFYTNVFAAYTPEEILDSNCPKEEVSCMLKTSVNLLSRSINISVSTTLEKIKTTAVNSFNTTKQLGSSLTASAGSSLTSVSTGLADGWISFTQGILNNIRDSITNTKEFAISVYDGAKFVGNSISTWGRSIPSKIVSIWNSTKKFVIDFISQPPKLIVKSPIVIPPSLTTTVPTTVGIPTEVGTPERIVYVSTPQQPATSAAGRTIIQRIYEQPQTTIINQTDPTLFARIQGIELALQNSINHDSRQTDRTYDSISQSISSASNSITEEGTLNDTTLNSPIIDDAAITNFTATGQTIFTKVPTLAHAFTTWPLGTSNISDASIYINPASAVADSNLLGLSVGGVVKFLVDAEGDIYGKNLILAGSTSTGETTIGGNLSVQDNTILGDAGTNTVTIHGVTTLDNIFSQTGAYTFSTGTGAVSLNGPTSITGTNTLTVGTGLATLGGGLNVAGNVGIGITNPTAYLNIKAGTAAAETAPLKFTSGSLLTNPEAGAVEFLTDAYYGTVTTLAIGDSYEGGVIVYILQAGDLGYVAGYQKGLIAATSDQSSGTEWGCNLTTITGADGTAIGTGNQNTIDIMNGCAEAGIAARLAGNLVLNGYSDWYLPSKDELNQVYINRAYLGVFSSRPYWTSSEVNAQSAWGQSFDTGAQGDWFGGKTAPNAVRSVRSFSVVTRGKFAFTSDVANLYVPYTGGTTNVDLGIHNLTVDTNSLFVDSVNHKVGIGTTSPTNIFSLGNTSAQKIWIENTINTVVGRALTISAGSTVTGGTIDMAGGNLILNSGLGKGTGASSIIFQTGRTLTTGSTLQTLTTAMTILGSGNIGIGTTNPRTALEVAGNADGAILATGTYGSGWTEPNLGAGARMLWYPRKAAFRAGYVDGTQWDNANIGLYSTAMGYGTKASGNFSIAMGQNTTVSGNSSIAMGYYTTANGSMSTAMGQRTTASGDYSTAMGSYTTASGINSTAMGDYTTASGYDSFAIGRYNVGGGTAGSWVATDPLFEIGIGTASDAKANALTVLKNGNVGIGVVSPGAKLDIRDSNTTAVSSDTFWSGTFSGMSIWNTSSTANAVSGIWLRGGAGGNAIGGIGLIQTTANVAGALGFFTGPSGSTVPERMRIDKDGNVGIGTVSPGGYLDVNPTYTGATVTSIFNQKSGFTLNNAAATVTNWYGGYIAAPTITAGAITNKYAFVTEANAGNVGIGTTGPTTGHLQVQGTTAGPQIYSVSSATTGGNYGVDAEATGSGATLNVGGYFYATGATTNRGIQIYGPSSGANNYAIYSEATAQSYFNGNVGIGTTNPTGQLTLSSSKYNTPDVLQTYTAINQSIFNSYYTGAANGAGGPYPRFLDIASVGAPDGTNGGGVIRFLTNPITLSSPAVERMRINDTGNVGIGTGATAPASLLDVQGDARANRYLVDYQPLKGRTVFEDYQSGGIRITGTTSQWEIADNFVRGGITAVGSTVMYLGNGFILPKGYSGSMTYNVGVQAGSFGVYLQSTTDWVNWTTLETHTHGSNEGAITHSFSSLTAPTALRFYFLNSNGTSTSRNDVDTIVIPGLDVGYSLVENVGQNLFMAGNIGIGTTNPGTLLGIGDGTGGAGVTINSLNYPGIVFQQGGVTSYVVQTRADVTGKNLVFRLADTTNVMTLDNSGNVGITGSILINQAAYGINNGNSASIGSNGILSLNRGSGAGLGHIYFNNGGNEVGSITSNTTSTAYNTSSDRRLKENIATTTAGLSTLLQISVEDFNFIRDPSSRVQGFIAQDLYNYYPEAVYVGGDNPTENPWSVDYGRITPLLVKAIQEMNLKVEDMSSLDTTSAMSLGSLIKRFLADIGNGLEKIFVREVNTDTLCVSDATGAKTCINKAQLDDLLAGAGGAGSDSSSSGDETPPEKTPTEKLQDANAKITALVISNYTADSAASFAVAKDAALLLPETNDTEKLAKVKAIDDALALLVLKPAPPTCTLPQILEGDTCVTPPLTCTAPQILEGDVCVTPPPVCTAPQILEEGACVNPI